MRQYSTKRAVARLGPTKAIGWARIAPTNTCSKSLGTLSPDIDLAFPLVSGRSTVSVHSYPASERCDLEHTFKGKQCGKGCVRVLKRHFVLFTLIVILYGRVEKTVERLDRERESWTVGHNGHHRTVTESGCGRARLDTGHYGLCLKFSSYSYKFLTRQR